MTNGRPRTEQQGTGGLDLEYQEQYELALRRSAQEGVLAVQTASLTTSRPGRLSKRMRAQREETQAQLEAILATHAKGKYAAAGMGFLAREISDDHTDTVEHFYRNKHRADQGEFQAHINGFANHLAEVHGLHLSKINSAAAMRVTELVTRDVYCPPPEETWLERFGLK